MNSSVRQRREQGSLDSSHLALCRRKFEAKSLACLSEMNLMLCSKTSKAQMWRPGCLQPWFILLPLFFCWTAHGFPFAINCPQASWPGLAITMILNSITFQTQCGSVQNASWAWFFACGSSWACTWDLMKLGLVVLSYNRSQDSVNHLGLQRWLNYSMGAS